MNKNISDFEIMAPVGSYDSLAAAIQGGADSIYFGIEGLNMRAKSSNNFTIDDLNDILGRIRVSRTTRWSTGAAMADTTRAV